MGILQHARIRNQMISMVVATSLVSSVLWSASPASAALACSTFNPASRFAGAVSPYSGSVYGSYANIEINNPDLCGNDADDVGWSSSWAMVKAPSILDPNNYAFNGYAQTGYLEAGDDAGATYVATGIRSFAQWTLACKSTNTCGPNGTATGPNDRVFENIMWGPALSAGTDSVYAVFADYDNHNGHILFQVGDSVIATSGYSPSGEWQSSWRSEFMGETHRLADDLPGVQNDVTLFDELAYVDGNQAAQYHASVTAFKTTSPATPRYFTTVFDPPSNSPQGVKVWTHPLS